MIREEMLAKTVWLKARFFRNAPRDWQVWIYSDITGDRKDMIGSYNTKAQAAKVCREYNRAE